MGHLLPVHKDTRMTQAAVLSVAGDGLAELVDPILQEALYWFPVRHHSPAAAHFTASAIARRKPHCVLLEAPSHLQHLLPFLLEKTRPPVALYSSARPLANADNSAARGGTSWYPLLEYSPECRQFWRRRKLVLRYVLSICRTFVSRCQIPS